MDFRVGTGLDFHRLIEDAARPLLLGGFEIPGELALEGHSDADIVLHAVADAILGGLAEGDIGMLFPDTDVSLKNMDSARIIREALRRMRAKGFRLSNIDVTLIGEKPRINAHRGSIQKSLAALLELALDRIGIKATTTEKMGALGRAEGLACFASVSLVRRM